MLKKLLLRPPTFEDILHVLTAWRVWMGGAILGAIIAGLLYMLFPPYYRAQATVLVDQNAEQAVPEEQTDLTKYAFLQRETDNLIEIAWADITISRVAAQTSLPVEKLRDSLLHLSQPGNGGWHFLADSADPKSASLLATDWAKAFVEEVQSKPAGINPLLEINFTQQEDLPVGRSVSLGIYIFCGSLLGVSILAFLLLFVEFKKI
jgi:uncharacterized protein involved in exopolysaccharide biosynthesis